MILLKLYRIVGSILSPAGKNAKLSILIYHRVLSEQDPLYSYEVTKESFNVQMSQLKAVFNVLPLAEAIERLKNGTLPARAACITFDDGYADNATTALPILQRHGLKATFFIAIGYLNGGRMFNDTVTEAIRCSSASSLDLTFMGLGSFELSSREARVRAINTILPAIKYLPVGEREALAEKIAGLATSQALPDNLMMTTAQLRSLHQAGMEIGGHTVRHPILSGLDTESARQEIIGCKRILEEQLGAPVSLFAYPNGKPGRDYLAEHVRIVGESGFSAAVTTRAGCTVDSGDMMQLPRYTPWQSDIKYFIPGLLRNLRRTAV